MGRQPWIVQGLLKTDQANSPNVSTTWLGISLGVFVALYVILGVVDFVLMRRYARPGRPEPREELPGAGGDLLMTLENVWFCLIAVSVGRLLRARGLRLRRRHAAPVRSPRRARAERDVRVDRPGVGRERGLARRRRRARPSRRSPPGTGRCSRASTSRSCCSLSFLIVRVVSFEWRGKSDEPALAPRLDVGERRRQHRHRARLGHRALEPPARRADRFERQLRRRLLGSVHRYTILGGIAFVLVFAFHGAIFLTLRTLGDLLRARASRGADPRGAGRGGRRRLSHLDGRRRGRPKRQERLPARAAGGDRDRERSCWRRSSSTSAGAASRSRSAPSEPWASSRRSSRRSIRA